RSPPILGDAERHARGIGLLIGLEDGEPDRRIGGEVTMCWHLHRLIAESRAKDLRDRAERRRMAWMARKANKIRAARERTSEVIRTEDRGRPGVARDLRVGQDDRVPSSRPSSAPRRADTQDK